MRLRILELPMEVVGGTSRTPFAVILDRCEPQMLTPEVAAKFKEELQAEAVLTFLDEIDLE
ncbi:hypothetical protein [Nocardia otitidiscaviarum]|uniref:hypothetical protein n=1 Tax=Nocardia otitidiscaviarum TaxID=1823 RepID=UPI0004A70A3C|nr:hypothetical protein [Nocardia otitidiscaviarum]